MGPPKQLKTEKIVFGYATEQAFKKRRGTFSEHEQGDTHKVQVQSARMKLVLAEGKLPPAETGKIFGFVTLIDPYTDTELKRWIRLERKISPLIRTPMILSSRKEKESIIFFWISHSFYLCCKPE